MKESDKLVWKCFAFYELTNTLLYNVLAERAKIFVVEQDCAYNDIDGIDVKSHHVIGFYGNEIAAYGRLLPAETVYEEMSIGRVMTPQSFRNKGFGKALMEQCIDKCYEIFEEGDIKIDAQLYLKRFYEYFGFKQVGDKHDVDGIAHIYMLLNKK